MPTIGKVVERDWTLMTFMMPPTSMLPRHLASYLKELGLVFDEELMGWMYHDGSVVEQAPCYPHPISRE